MKKFLLLSLFAVVLLVGCSKDKEDSPYFVKYTVNGQQKSYTGYTFGHFEPVGGGLTELSILGANTPSADDNYMGIYINNYPGVLPITTGVYEDSSLDFTVLATHSIDDVESYGGQSVSDDIVQYGISGHNRLKVTITEITSTNIRGTFSGDYYEGGDVLGGM